MFECHGDSIQLSPTFLTLLRCLGCFLFGDSIARWLLVILAFQIISFFSFWTTVHVLSLGSCNFHACNFVNCHLFFSYWYIFFSPIFYLIWHSRLSSWIFQLILHLSSYLYLFDCPSTHIKLKYMRFWKMWGSANNGYFTCKFTSKIG